MQVIIPVVQVSIPVMQVSITVMYPVLRIGDVYPWSEFFHPGSRIQGQKGSESALKNLTQKIVSKLSEISSGMFIQDPDFFPIPNPWSRWSTIRILDPGVEKAQKNTVSRIWISNTALYCQKIFWR